MSERIKEEQKREGRKQADQKQEDRKQADQKREGQKQEEQKQADQKREGRKQEDRKQEEQKRESQEQEDRKQEDQKREGRKQEDRKQEDQKREGQEQEDRKQEDQKREGRKQEDRKQEEQKREGQEQEDPKGKKQGGEQCEEGKYKDAGVQQPKCQPSSQFLIARYDSDRQRQMELLCEILGPVFFGEKRAATEQELEQFFRQSYSIDVKHDFYEGDDHYEEYLEAQQAIAEGMSIYGGSIVFEDSALAELADRIWRDMEKCENGGFRRINTALEE